MTGLEVAVRFVHLASVLLLVGSFSFELLVSRPVFKNVGIQTGLDFPSFYKTLFSIARLSLLLAIGTAVIGLFIKIADATGLPLSESLDLGTIMNVLTGTRFGIGLVCPNGALLPARCRDVGSPAASVQKRFSWALRYGIASERYSTHNDGRRRSRISRRGDDTFHPAHYGRASSFSSGRMVGRPDPPRVIL